MRKIITAAAIAGAVITGGAGLAACDSGAYSAPYVTARYECAGGTGYCVEYSDYSYEYVPYPVWDTVYVGAVISRSSSGAYSLSRASGYSGSYTRITSVTHLTTTTVKPYTLSKGTSSTSYSPPASSFKSRSAYSSYKSSSSSKSSSRSSGSSTKSKTGSSSYKSRSGSSSYKSTSGHSSYKSSTSRSSYHSSSDGGDE